MANWLSRLRGGRSRAPMQVKSTQTLFSLSPLGISGGSRKGFAALANEGFARNPVVYRCVRLVAENAARVPLEVRDGERMLTDHPLLSLLKRPNRRQDGKELLESVFSYLQIAGNAYLDAAIVEGEVKGLYGLRPDRMAVIAGKDGWPVGYAYTAGGKTAADARYRAGGAGAASIAVRSARRSLWTGAAGGGAGESRNAQRGDELEPGAAGERGAPVGGAGL